jgi:hypothetical protein
MTPHHKHNSLSYPLPHALNDQDVQSKNIIINTKHPVTPLPVNNSLPLLSNNHNPTPQTDATTYLNRLGEACMTPLFLTLDLAPPNEK